MLRPPARLVGLADRTRRVVRGGSWNNHRDEGVTIRLITHEPDIAACASRQLTLCDGVLTG
jgi:predicted ABC-type transport system involved in lysophospholipase L1 biosynthesis ATPase subunit